MKKIERHDLFSILKRYLLTGLVVTAPTFITIGVFIYVFDKLDRILGGFFNLWLGFRIPGLGFIALMILIMIAGFLTSFYIGKKFLSLGEFIFTRLPIARTVYLTVKQLQELIKIRKSIVFHCAVLMEYPRRDIWVVGFLSSNKSTNLNGEDLFPIFVPTTPNPTSGFLILARENEFIRLSMPIDEAMKLVVSAGIIQPNISINNESKKIEAA